MYYIEITPLVLWILGALLIGLGALLGLVLYNLSELHYRLNVIIVNENRRQSSIRTEYTRAGAIPPPRRY